MPSNLSDQSFPKDVRLRRRAEYLAVQGRGRKVVGEHLMLLFVRTGSARLGVTVSSKVGGATVRARLRRWVREYARRHKDELPSGDVVIILRSSAAAIEHAVLDRDLGRALGRARGLP